MPKCLLCLPIYSAILGQVITCHIAIMLVWVNGIHAGNIEVLTLLAQFLVPMLAFCYLNPIFYSCN
uniref:Uncharacterized protein n=1 Tax=Rhizophora mucronata TaxID=61149 RepID=A0A2P2Q0K5_RHIMU